MAKKKIGNKQAEIESDQILIALKERYFKLYARENIPVTPTTTSILDKLEQEIRNRINELIKI